MKKPISSIIMASLGKKPDASSDGPDMDPGMDHSTEIAKDILDAVKTNDPQMLSDSLRAIFDSFDSDSEPSEPEGV